jgi:hypothetical protein
MSLAASEVRYFGGTKAPTGATRLYIIDAGCTIFSGTGLPFVTVYNKTTGAILKLDDTITNMQWQNKSMRAARNQGTAPYVFRSVKVSPGTQIQLRVDEGTAVAVTAAAYVTYAWGF